MKQSRAVMGVEKIRGLMTLKTLNIPLTRMDLWVRYLMMIIIMTKKKMEMQSAVQGRQVPRHRTDHHLTMCLISLSPKTLWPFKRRGVILDQSRVRDGPSRLPLHTSFMRPEETRVLLL